MELQQDILSTLNEDVRRSISQKTNVDPTSVDAVIETALPVLLGTLGKNASKPKGAKELAATLEQKHDGSELRDLSGLFAGGDTNGDGLKILSHVFGTASTGTTANIANKTGVDMATVIKVLSFIAPIVLAQLGKKKADANLDAGGLSDLLKRQKTTGGGSLMDIATQFLDKNKDGQIVDDLLTMFTKKGK